MKKIVKLSALVLALTFVSFINAQSIKDEFYRTKRGEKYHKKECKTIKEKDVLKVSLKETKKKGLVACKVCKPSKKAAKIKERKSTNKVKLNSKKTVAKRCTGTTQKGAQCKRMTKSSDGTCWQH